MNETHVIGFILGIVSWVIFRWLVARRRKAKERMELIESVLSRIRERAERVLGGEGWELAPYVVKTIAELE